MKSRDEILLEQSYDEIAEGIWDRLKGQGAGIKAGIKQGAQNVAGRVAGALGATVAPPTQTMGQAYAKNQQKSLFFSFADKMKSEIAEFEADMMKLGKADVAALKASHPEIEKLITQYKQLLTYINSVKGSVATRAR